MLYALELKADDHYALIKHCNEKHIKFLSSAFDAESIELLQKLDLEFWKIPSGEITNLPYLRQIGKLKENNLVDWYGKLWRNWSL